MFNQWKVFFALALVTIHVKIFDVEKGHRQMNVSKIENFFVRVRKDVARKPRERSKLKRDFSSILL